MTDDTLTDYIRRPQYEWLYVVRGEEDYCSECGQFIHGGEEAYFTDDGKILCSERCFELCYGFKPGEETE